MIGTHLLAATKGGSFGGWPLLVFGVIALAIGTGNLLAPGAMFRLGMFGYNWEYARRPQPSAGYMSFTRIGGAFGILMGLACIVFALVHH